MLIRSYYNDVEDAFAQQINEVIVLVVQPVLHAEGRKYILEVEVDVFD